MAFVVRALPVLPGKEDALRQFAQEVVGDKRARDLAIAFGVVHLSWYLQRMVQGSCVICLAEVARDPAAMARAYAASQGTFERYVKDRVRELTGVDLDRTPFDRLPETILEWNTGRQPAGA